jgi:hypothetical protein
MRRAALAALAAILIAAVPAAGSEAAGLRAVKVRSLEPRLQEVTLQLTGSGSAVVRTPGFYAPRSRHRVVASGRRLLLRADQDGRLRIPLRLGPANRFQQFSPEEKANPSRFYRVAVTVKPAG